MILKTRIIFLYRMLFNSLLYVNEFKLFLFIKILQSKLEFLFTMWVSTKKNLNDHEMFFRFYQKDGYCIFNLTNMKKIYDQKIKESMLDSIYSSTNQTIEVEATNIIEFLRNINKKSNLDYNLNQENSNIRMDITIFLTEGFPSFKLKLLLELKDADYFYSHITYPLLKLIQSLNKNQEELFNVLKKKDSEIEEYKLEGGHILHENIRTETFEKDKFLKKNNDLYDGSTNLFELYSSPIIEQFINQHSDKNKELKLIEVGNEEFQHIPLKRKCFDHKSSSSTAIEITHTSINVKKKKTHSLLKNL